MRNKRLDRIEQKINIAINHDNENLITIELDDLTLEAQKRIMESIIKEEIKNLEEAEKRERKAGYISYLDWSDVHFTYGEVQELENARDKTGVLDYDKISFNLLMKMIKGAKVSFEKIYDPKNNRQSNNRSEKEA